MVVTTQNGNIFSCSYGGAGAVVAETPDKARGKADKKGVVYTNKAFVVYRVSFNQGKTGGYYTGIDQAEEIINAFNQAMDNGQNSFTFPPDTPKKKGIFKA